MRHVLLLAVLAALGGGAVFAHLPESEAVADTHALHPHVTHAQEIEAITLDGRSLPLAQLRAALASRTGEILDTAKLERDRASLKDVMVARGYLLADVDTAKVSFDADGGAFVSFPVRTGALFHVRTVRVTGPGAASANVVTLVPGEDAAPESIEGARSVVEASVSRDAKHATPVVAKLTRDDAASMVDVELQIQTR